MSDKVQPPLEPTPPRAASRWRRLRRFAAWSVAVLALALAALWLTRNEWLAPWLLRRARATVAQRFGYELEVGAFRGAWSDSIELEGVRLVARDEHGVLRRLEARSIGLEYDLIRLLKGDVGGLQRVELREVRVEVDADAPARAREPSSAAQDPLLELWPELVLADVQLRGKLGAERSIAIAGLHARLGSSASGGAFECSCDALRLEGDWPTAARSFRATARGELTPTHVRATSLEVRGDAELTNGRAQLALERLVAGELSWSLAGDCAGGSLALEARHWGEELAVDFELRELETSTAYAWLRGEPDSPIEGRATLRGELQGGADGLWLWVQAQMSAGCVLARPFDELEFEGAWTPREVWVADLRARQGDNLLTGRRLRAPLEQQTWPERLRAARGEFELVALDVPALVGADSDAAPAHAFQLAGQLDERGLELSGGRLQTLDAALWLERGRVLWGADPSDWLRGAELELAALADFADLSRLGAVIGAPGWSGRGSGVVRVSGPLSEPHGDLDLVGEAIALGELQLGEVAVRARLGAGQLEIAELRASGELGELELDGHVDLKQERLRDVRLRFATRDVARVAAAIGASAVSQYVREGELELQARCEGAWLDPDGEVQLAARGVTALDGRVFEELRVSVQRRRARWQVDELALRSGDSAARVGGVVHHELGATSALVLVDSLRLSHGEADLALVRAGTVAWDDGRLVTSLVELAGSAGAVALEVRAAPDDMRIALEALEFQPLVFLAPLLPSGAECAAARGELELLRSGAGWSGRADLELNDARWDRGWPKADLVLVAQGDEFALQVERIFVDAADAGQFELSGVAERSRTRPLGIDSAYVAARGAVSALDLARWPWDEVGLGARLRGRLEASFELALRDGDPKGRLHLDIAELSVQPSDALALGPANELRGFNVALEARLDDELVVENCEIRAPERVEIVLSASLGGAARWLVTLGESALPDDAALALRAHWRIGDLSWLANLTPVLRRVEGALSGDLVAGGSWRQPQAQGSWVWSGGALRLGLDAPPFERVEARGSVSGSRLSIESLLGELGGGPFELSGAVDLAGPGEFDLHLRGSELLVLRERDLRARANADLRLSGTFAAPLLSGVIGAREGRWRQRIEWLPSAPAPVVARRGGELPFTIRGGMFERLRYDLAIESAGDFVIETNLGKINLRPALQLAGRADSPTLAGAIFLDPTRISLPGSTLDLRAGTILFDEFAPTTPTIDVTATTRVLGYDITARVSGRIDDLERQLSSTPPLRSEDISVMLLTGRAPRDLIGNEVSVDAAQTVILFLGKDLLSSWTGGSSPLIERLEWRAGTDATRTGGSTAQVSVRVAGPASGPGSVMYLRGERDVYDRINYGVRWVVRLK